MWPHKEGLGITLSYGVDGNGTLEVKKEKSLSGEGVDIELDFARVKDDGTLLSEIGDSYQNLVEKQIPLFSINSRIYNNLEDTVNSSSKAPRKMYKDSQIFIPKDILQSYLVESKSLTSTIAYDPTYGDICPVSEIRSRNGQSYKKVMAYVTGEGGNILNISSLTYERIEVKNGGMDRDKDVLVPELHKPFQIALSEPIKQIEFCKIVFDYVPSMLIIRTSSKIYLLSCFHSLKKQAFSKSSIELDIIGEIISSELNGLDFADVSFNPHNYSQFAIVDIKGNFSIWNVKRDNLTKLKRVDFDEKSNVVPSVYDVSELSNWKKIRWTNDPNVLIVLTRSSVTQFTITPELKSLKLITSNTWSQIQDYYRYKDHAFLLTSKEIIWLRLASPVVRLISWKHFLDDNDPSLKMHISEFDDGNRFLCLLYSQMHPLIFVYNFGFKNNKPYSLRDPYYIRRADESGDLHQLFLHKLNKYFFNCLKDMVDENDLVEESDLEISSEQQIYGLFELNTDFSLSVSLLCEEKGLSLWKIPTNDEVLKSKPLIRKSGKFFNHFSKSEFKTVVSSLVDDNKEISNEEEIRVIQDYAFKLGEGALRINNDIEQCKGSPLTLFNEEPSYSSLIDISKDLPININDVTEFDSMIEQLSNFYKEKDINIANTIKHGLINHSKILNTSIDNIKSSYNIADIFKFIKNAYQINQSKEYNLNKNVIKTSILLGASSLRASSNYLENHYKEQFEEAKNKAPENVQSIIELWDSDEGQELDGINNNINSQRTAPSIQSSMPTIRLTQERKPPRNSSSKGKERPLYQTALANNSQSHSLSYSSSQINNTQEKSSGSVLSQPIFPISHSQTESEDIYSSNDSFSSQSVSSLKGTKRFASSQPQPLRNSQRKTKKKKKGGFA